MNHILMNNDTAFNLENYNFNSSYYSYPTNSNNDHKFDYYDAQIYPSSTTQMTAGYHHTYNDDFTMAAVVPVVPSQQQISIYSNNNIPSSPESIVSSSTTLNIINDNNKDGISFTEKINQQVNTLPDAFLPEFHQYSKETYENGSGGGSHNTNNKKRHYVEEDDTTTAELRRQVHILSEQKRRAQIKDGFDILRKELPGCTNNRKMSKATLLKRTVQHLQHLKKNQISILAEIERLVEENEKLKMKH